MLPNTKEERKAFYEKSWNSFLWRGLFKLFFSRRVMGLAGRDPAFFDQVKGSVSERILARTKHALTEIETYNNPYLTYIITGNFSKTALPLYLREEHFDTIRNRLDRLTLATGGVESARGPFKGFNLSDIFEYMNESKFCSCYKQLLDLSEKGARLAYWNMLVPRSAPQGCQTRVHLLKDVSDRLYREDKAWFYQAFNVEETV